MSDFPFPSTPPAPTFQWALIVDDRVESVITSPTEPHAPEAGAWVDATGQQIKAGMVYTDGLYSLPRWAQIVGGRVMTVVEQIESPGDGWQDCTGQHVGPGMLVDGGSYSAPAKPRHITVLAFRNRFAQSEKVAVEIASLDDPSAPMPQRALAAALRTNQLDVQAAAYIDLDRADTRAGVLSLEAGTLLGAGRALEILDAPIAAHEEFRP